MRCEITEHEGRGTGQIWGAAARQGLEDDCSSFETSRRFRQMRFLSCGVRSRAGLAVMALALLVAVCGPASSSAATAPPCGETLSSGAAASYEGTVCVSGTVYLDQAASFGSVVVEPGGAFYVGYPPGVGSAAAGCSNGWNGTITVKGQVLVEAKGELLLNSSTSCNGGGATLLAASGGFVNDGTVVAATSGTIGTTTWSDGGQRTLQGSFLNKGTVTVNAALVLVGRGTFQNDGKITVGVYAGQQGEQGYAVTVPAPGKGQGALTFVNGPGGVIALAKWHKGTSYVFASFTVSGPNTFAENGGKTTGAPVVDLGATLSYAGKGASTIGIASPTTIKGTIPARSVLALSDPAGGGSETCGAAALVDTAPKGLTIAKGATVMAYGSAPCGSGPQSTTLKIGRGKSLVNNGTIIAGSCGTGATLLPGVYGKPDVFCIGGQDIFTGRTLNNGKITVEGNVPLSFSNLANYQPKTHTLKGGHYSVATGGSLTVAGTPVHLPA